MSDTLRKAYTPLLEQAAYAKGVIEMSDYPEDIAARPVHMTNEKGLPERIIAWEDDAGRDWATVPETMSNDAAGMEGLYIPSTRVEELERTRQLVMDEAIKLAGQVFKFERALEEIAGPCVLPHRCGQRNRYCGSCIAAAALAKHRGEL